MTTDPCWARVGVPLEAYAEGFRAELRRLGYTPLTAAGHVRLMAHLARLPITVSRDIAGAGTGEPAPGRRVLGAGDRGKPADSRHRR